MRNGRMILAFVCVALVQRSLSAPYKPTWDSLSKHEAAPQWLKDAKLGIYFHWGAYAVPAYSSEWYPRNMFLKSHDVNKHHIETYGDPAEYGYDRFVDQWQTPHFDAKEWAALFRRAGARFAGPVAEHHDGFSLWDSEVTPWNAKDKGPKRDLVGELAEAIRGEGMKLITTFHHARNHYGHYDGMKKDYPQAMTDPEVAFLYGQMPAEQFHDVWYTKLKEVIDQYQPEIIWFDSWLDKIPEDYRQRFAAYYLNEAAKWGKDVAIIRKQNDMPLNFTMNDHEKSREPKALPELWMTDDTLSTGSWCYTQSLKIKPFDMVLHALIDIVSKNGVLLLNISPKADGTIPQDQRESLIALGDWLDVNGEAIYATQPWIIAAECPAAAPTGGFKNHQAFMKLKYSEKDIRYTTSKDGKTVYAILLGAPPANSTVTLTAFAGQDLQIAQVKMLSGQAINGKMTDAGLAITIPSTIDAKQHATVLKINLK
ncbi:alpha-L-fucosidase [Planctomycetota bacterium]